MFSLVGLFFRLAGGRGFCRRYILEKLIRLEGRVLVLDLFIGILLKYLGVYFLISLFIYFIIFKIYEVLYGCYLGDI